MLPAFGGAAMSTALTHHDATLAASCHAVARGIGLRAKAADDVAPPLYFNMVGIPAIGAYGLMDRDLAAAQLGLKKRPGARAVSVSFAAPLILGDDPTLINEHGYHVVDHAKDAYRLTEGDLVCLQVRRPPTLTRARPLGQHTQRPSAAPAR